jgi:hypothetical protein
VRTAKLVGAVALALVIAVAAGWVWGRSGQSTLEGRARESDLRLRLTDAKSRILGARVDLYSLNFGAAAQNMDAARSVVESVLATWEPEGTSPRAAQLKIVVKELDEGRRIAGQMRQDAHVQADRALRALSAAAHAPEAQ